MMPILAFLLILVTVTHKLPTFQNNDCTYRGSDSKEGCYTLTPANGDEREAIWDIMRLIQGLLIGDKGYITAPLRQELERYGIDLQTALRSNMHDIAPENG